MGQILIRNLDETKLERLKVRAKADRTSVEALAREAVHRVADELSVAEKLALVEALQAKFAAAMVPGVAQTPAVDLIREDRTR